MAHLYGFFFSLSIFFLYFVFLLKLLLVSETQHLITSLLFVKNHR